MNYMKRKLLCHKKLALALSVALAMENLVFSMPVSAEAKGSISVNSIEANRSIVSDDGIQSDNTKNEINIQSESFTRVDVSEDEDGSVLADYDGDTGELRIYPGESGTKVLKSPFIESKNYVGDAAILTVSASDVNKVVVESGVIAPESSWFLFDGFDNAESIDISGFDTSNVTDMSYMFRDCSSLESLDVSGFDTSNVTDMRFMFEGCSSLESLDVSGFDTSNVTNMSVMFEDCSSLESLDLSGFDTSNVTDMSDMFFGCGSLESLDVSGFDTSNVLFMIAMFEGCNSLESLDVSGFDTSNVTDMVEMFRDCGSLENLDVSGFDTSKVTDMSEMFRGCSSLESLDVSGFDTSSVLIMSCMFYGCSSLESLDVSGFDTSNVINMGHMFHSCSSLESLDVSGFDTSSVLNMSGMFLDCSSMESLDISGFDTFNVLKMDWMFCGCNSLKSLDVSGFDTSKVCDVKCMFSDCCGLKSLDLGSFNLTSLDDYYEIEIGGGTYSGDIDGNVCSSVWRMLEDMDSLELITTPKAISPSYNDIGVTYDVNNVLKCRKLYDDDGNTYYYLPVDGSKTLHVEAIQSSTSGNSGEGSTSGNSGEGSTSGNNSSGTSSSEATMVTEDGITHPTAVTFTGKKAKLDNVSIVYNGTTYSSGSIKFKYKNAKHAGTATAIIRKIIGDKEATKAFRGKSFTFVINPYEVSSNEVTTKTKKDGTIRKVRVTIGGKSRSVKKSMWSASGSEITFSGDYSGTVKVT